MALPEIHIYWASHIDCVRSNKYQWLEYVDTKRCWRFIQGTPKHILGQLKSQFPKHKLIFHDRRPETRDWSKVRSA